MKGSDPLALYARDRPEPTEPPLARPSLAELQAAHLARQMLGAHWRGDAGLLAQLRPMLGDAINAMAAQKQAAANSQSRPLQSEDKGGPGDAGDD